MSSAHVDVYAIQIGARCFSKSEFLFLIETLGGVSTTTKQTPAHQYIDLLRLGLCHLT